MIKVSMVPPEHVMECWEHVKEHLAGAIQYTYGRFELDDILTSITDYDHQLWVAFDDERDYGAVVTNFVVYPRKKYVNLAFVGGVEGHRWKGPMLELLQHWAYDNDCDGIESIGRPGWAKIFKNDGYKQIGCVYEIPAAKTGIGV